MAKGARASCDDCYFKRAGLCALPGDTPCPTFRPYRAGVLKPPPQAALIPRRLAPLAGQAAA